ncbi:MAG: hypothetical protein V7637_5765 [Mycobacteriales bacterium]
MRWPGDAARAERFARLLDDSSAGTGADPELARLAAIAGRLRAVEPVLPHAEFRATLRAHLISLVGPVPAPRADPAGRTEAGTTQVDVDARDLDAAALDTRSLDAGGRRPDELEPDELDAGEPEPDGLEAGGPEAGGLEAAGGPEPDEPGAGALDDGGPRAGGTEAGGTGELDEDGRPPERRLRLVPPVQRSGRWRRPRVSLIAASLVLFLLAGVAVLSSRNAMPGDALYALKRGTENAELRLARGDEARGRRYLELARTRAGEVEDLATDRDADPTTLVDTLGTMDQQTKAGVRLLTIAAVGRSSDDLLVFVGTWASQQYQPLLKTLPSLPRAAQQRLLESATLLSQVSERVSVLRTQLGCACLAGAPTDELGTYPCKGPCAGAQKPASATPTGIPTRPPGRPSETGVPRPTTPASGSAAPRPTRGPGQGGGGNPAPSRGPGTSAPGGGGGLPVPLPLPTGGGSLPLPSIPGLPLPTSLPLPLPLPTSGLPLPTGLLPSLLPGAGG